MERERQQNDSLANGCRQRAPEGVQHEQGGERASDAEELDPKQAANDAVAVVHPAGRLHRRCDRQQMRSAYTLYTAVLFSLSIALPPAAP